MKINKQTAQAIIDEYIEGYSRKDIAIKYDICDDYVYQIITGKCYQECNRPNNLSQFWQRGKNKHKLNKLMAQEIINRYLNGENSNFLADHYEVSTGAIISIVNGKNYKKCIRPANITDIINERNYVDNQHWRIKKNESLPSLSQSQLDIITGSLLGDGCISKKYHINCRLSKMQCLKHKEYLIWHLNQLAPYSTKLYENHTDRIIINHNKRMINYKTNIKKLKGYSLGTISHPVFTDLREKWYPENKKIVPKDISLTPLSIAIWYCDDGSNDYRFRKASIFTNGFTFDEVYFLAEKLKIFNLFPKIESREGYKGKQPTLRFYSNS